MHTFAWKLANIDYPKRKFNTFFFFMINRIALIIMLIIGAIIHIYSLSLAPILTIPDSFAYLQMAHHLRNFSLEWIWTWWFWPLYSFFLAFWTLFSSSDYEGGKIINVILWVLSSLTLYHIGKRYLNLYYNLLLIFLFSISSSLLYYKIHLLAENLYLPLFLLLILLFHRFLEKERWLNALLMWLVLGAMYLTRGEAFIYTGPILIVFFILSLLRFFSFWEMIKHTILLIVWWSILGFPYIYHLHSITWEWGLTNKWSSNIRQAILRGAEKMDDDGFEKAVWELDATKTKLKSGFVGWLKYEEATETYSFKEYLLSGKYNALQTIEENQKKILKETLPRIFLGNIINFSRDVHYPIGQNIWFLIATFIPIFFFLYGGIKMLINREINLFFTVFPLFITAFLFFSLFFVLERYFIVFVPFFIIVMLYGCQYLFFSLSKLEILKFIIFASFLISLYWVGMYHFKETNNGSTYKIKQNVGKWVQEHLSIAGREIKIMERWPIVTYYSGTKERWLTPYTNNIEDIIIYAKAHQIDYLIADTLDFLTYRPELNNLLKPWYTYKWLKEVYSYTFWGNKVIVYKFIY